MVNWDDLSDVTKCYEQKAHTDIYFGKKKDYPSHYLGKFISKEVISKMDETRKVNFENYEYWGNIGLLEEVPCKSKGGKRRSVKRNRRRSTRKNR